MVSGGRDALLDSDSVELVEAIPGAHRIEYLDAAHLSHWEQPERLAKDVTAFADLRRVIPTLVAQ